ncbi:MAG: bile acid:sodium symporter [Bacteroidales bacterium]
MWKMIAYLQKKLIYSIPLSMIAGLLLGHFFDVSFLRSLILPLVFLMIYPMMVNLQIKKIFSGGDLKLQLSSLFISFAIIPFIAYGVGLLFFSNHPMLAMGLLLIGLIPTSGMTISWTGFGKGNLDAAIKMTVIGLFIGALLTPLYAQWLMGAAIDVPLLQIFQRIILVVFLPMLAGFLTQRFIIWQYGRERYRTDISQKFPRLSTLGVLGVVLVAMALRADLIISQPMMLLFILLPLLIFYGINYTISTLIGKYFFPRADSVALVYGTVLRNLSVALAVAIAVFGPGGSDIAFIISLAYIVQVQSAAWHIKFAEKLF